jgi:hypothetical protein
MAGSGNLLGSLLCGVAGLLDPRGFLDRLLGPIEELTLLLDFSNDSFR